MTLRIRISDSAAVELDDAYFYYESRQHALGDAFLDAFLLACQLLEEHPSVAPILLESVRRKLIAEFPYGIYYRVVNSEIEILAVMNLNRRPEAWAESLDRLQS